jgi:hypothetical protein
MGLPLIFIRVKSLFLIKGSLRLAASEMSSKEGGINEYERVLLWQRVKKEISSGSTTKNTTAPDSEAKVVSSAEAS